MIMDVVYKQNEMEISYIDAQRRLQIDNVPLSSVNDSGTYKNWLTTKIANDLPVRNWDGKYVTQYTGKRFNQFEFIKFMNELPKEAFDKYHAVYQPKCIACDFEMAIESGFPNAVDEVVKINGVDTIKKGGQTPIVSSAFVNEDYESVVFTLDSITKEQCEEVVQIVQDYLGPVLNKELKTRVVYAQDEYELLKYTAKSMKESDMLTGWNFVDYDMPFLQERLKKYGMNLSSTSKTSSVNYYQYPNHKFITDYLDLYKTYSKWNTAGIISHRLDVVADALLGIGKLPMNGMSLKELRFKDLPRFLAYNVIDSALVQMIHQRVASINAVYMLAIESWLSLQECRGPVAHSGAVMAQFFLREFPDQVIARQEETPYVYNYPGGFVKPPARGFGKNVGCLDYSSLYPSLMRCQNLSPSNYIATYYKFDYKVYEHIMKKFVQLPVNIKKPDIQHALRHSLLIEFHGYMVESVNCASTTVDFATKLIATAANFWSISKPLAGQVTSLLLKGMQVNVKAHVNAVVDPQLTMASYGGAYKNDKDYEYKAVQAGLYNRRKEYQGAQFKTLQTISNTIGEELERRKKLAQ